MVAFQGDRFWATRTPSAPELFHFEQVSKLPNVRVIRPPNDALVELGMQPAKCHDNAFNAAILHGLGRGEDVAHVHGWLRDPHFPDALVLHSVVRIRKVFICVTPSPVPAEELEFIPDTCLRTKVHRKTQTMQFYRFSYRVDYGLVRRPIDRADLAEAWDVVDNLSIR